MGMIWTWLGGRLAGLSAIALAAALAWQTARIEGWPLIGGGFKADVAGLQQQIASREAAQARAEATALAAQAQRVDAQNAIARAASMGDQAIQAQIQTVIRKVPSHVSVQADADCPVPWGVVRLLDAAASGADPGDVAAAIAPGQPDDAASGIKLSALVALQAANLGAARQNAGQLAALERAVTPP